MASLNNVEGSWEGTTETIKVIPPHRVPLGQFELFIYTDLRQVGGSTEAATADTLQFIPNKSVFGLFPFEYSIATSPATGAGTASTITALIDANNLITFGAIRGIARNRTGIIVVTR